MKVENKMKDRKNVDKRANLRPPDVPRKSALKYALLIDLYKRSSFTKDEVNNRIQSWINNHELLMAHKDLNRNPLPEMKVHREVFQSDFEGYNYVELDDIVEWLTDEDIRGDGANINLHCVIDFKDRKMEGRYVNIALLGEKHGTVGKVKSNTPEMVEILDVVEGTPELRQEVRMDNVYYMPKVGSVYLTNMKDIRVVE